VSRSAGLRHGGIRRLRSAAPRGGVQGRPCGRAEIAHLNDPGVRDRLGKLGNDTMNMTPAEFNQFVRREIDDYARVIKAAGIKAQ